MEKPTVSEISLILRKVRKIEQRINLAIWNLDRFRSERAFSHLNRAALDLNMLLEECGMKGKVKLIGRPRKSKAEPIEKGEGDGGILSPHG
ncbi:MAG: hypothetical protein QXQ76_03105 [Candidatus Bathyarchaeia archaeon]